MLDFLIKGGTIVDGTGVKPYRGDIGIQGERVVELGSLSGATAGNVLEADGLAVAPGFIDVHSHHDLYLVDQDPVIRFESFIRQGVTTCVVGNCGWTPAPCLPGTKHMVLELVRSMGIPMERFYWHSMKEYLSYIESRGFLCNIAQLVGHGTIRISVMGEENRFCTAEELEKMKALLRESMEAGCTGFSTGLMYYPGMYAHTNELIALAKVAGEYGRPYATHLRGYCTTLPNSLAEAITIAKEAGVPLQVSHLHLVPFLDKLANPLYHTVNLLEAINAAIPLPGLPNPELKKALNLIENALDQGMDIAIDVVPYTLGNTTVTVLFPPWASRGGKRHLLERLKDPESRRRMEKDIRTVVPRWPHWDEGSWSDPYIKAIGWKPIRVLSVKNDKNRWTEGKSFTEIAARWKTGPFEALCRLTLEEEAEVTFTFGYPARPWTEKIFNDTISHPRVSIGADSVLPSFGTPPPSAYGCFPRVLGHYCRELSLFPLEEAVRKMTGLSASRYNLRDRGQLKKGSFADIVVFDPAQINEKFTDKGLPAPAEGVYHVFINGTPVLWNREFSGHLRPGKLLREFP